MLKVEGSWQKDLRGSVGVGSVFDAEWVTIDNPELAHSPGTTDTLGVFKQGLAKGGAIFKRLEGAWYGSGLIYFNSTTGGNAGAGQVWEYNPGLETLRLIYESSSRQVLDTPDNITVSPRGGILLCEDGDGSGNPKRLMGLTKDGKLYAFAQNNVVLNGEKNGISGDFTKMEWAGATFSPDGKWLFVNIQAPGITFAITGNWAKGPL
jgi:secreted PhoX family phosphatase